MQPKTCPRRPNHWLAPWQESVPRLTIRKHLGIDFGETTPDGMFSMLEVECLGGCVNAPIVQVNDDFYEDLDAASVVKLLDACKAGQPPAPGPQIDRQTSAPAGEITTLKDLEFAKG